MVAVSENAKRNRKQYFANWYLKNKDRIAGMARKRYEKNREVILARQKASNTQRSNRYLRIYGITVDEYDTMCNSQNNTCGICGTDVIDKNGRRKYWCVDHCHITGKVRGLLCVSCNQFLGKFEKLADKAKQYLEGVRNG